MSNHELLVVLGSSLTALALVRSSHDANLKSCIVDTEFGIATKSRYCEVQVREGADDARIFDTLLELSRGRRVALVADSDRWLQFIAARHDELREAFLSIVHPEPSVINLCLNKSVFVSWCEENEFPAPRLYTVDGDGLSESIVEFPLLIRPQQTALAARQSIPKAVEVGNEDELAAWIRRYREHNTTPSVAQSLLRPNIKQYSIGIARRADGQVRVSMAEKIRSYADQCIGGTYVVSTEHKPIESLVIDAIERLDYFGIAECEVMYDPATNEAFFIEINARPWVQFGLTERTREYFLRFVLEQDIVDKTVAPNARWINFGADGFVCLSTSTGLIPHGRLAWWPYLRSIMRANSYATWDMFDPMPFIHSTQDLISRFVFRK